MLGDLSRFGSAHTTVPALCWQEDIVSTCYDTGRLCFLDENPAPIPPAPGVILNPGPRSWPLALRAAGLGVGLPRRLAPAARILLGLRRVAPRHSPQSVGCLLRWYCLCIPRLIRSTSGYIGSTKAAVPWRIRGGQALRWLWGLPPPPPPSRNARHKLLPGKHFQSKHAISTTAGRGLGILRWSPGMPDRLRRWRSGLKLFHQKQRSQKSFLRRSRLLTPGGSFFASEARP